MLRLKDKPPGSAKKAKEGRALPCRNSGERRWKNGGEELRVWQGYGKSAAAERPRGMICATQGVQKYGYGIRRPARSGGGCRGTLQEAGRSAAARG